MNIHDDVGAYLIGALEPEQAHAFAAHLADCAQCSAEVGELGGLLPVLAATELDAELLATLDTPPTSPSVVLASSSPKLAPAVLFPPAALPRRSRNRAVLWLVAAVVAVLVAVPAVLFLRSEPEPIDVAFPLAGDNSVRVLMTPTDSGSDLTVICHYEAAGRYDEHFPASIHLWVIGDDGSVVEALSWPTMAGDLTLPGTVGVSPDDVAALELRDSSGEVLASAPA